MKKILYVFLIVIALFLFTACGGNNDNNNKDKDEDIFKETQGVVILDNFEKFDEKIFEKYVNLISEIFPKIQFFISGNSFEMKTERKDIDYVDLKRGLF